MAAKPAVTPVPDEKPKRGPSMNVQVPRALFKEMRDALRGVAKDTRDEDDRALKDDTRKAVGDALDSLNDWYDSKVE